jgi:sulfatase maturation enzyme AslB (radical SAM superfamily)
MQNREVIEQAKQLIQQNKLKEAEEILSKINDKYAIFEIAKIKLIQGNDNEAEELYKKVLTLDDTIHEAVLELARIYARQKRTDLAMEFYNKYISKIDNNMDVYKEVGQLQESLGNNIEAVTQIEKARNLSPEDISINFELGRAYREAGEDKKSAEVFKQMLEKDEIKNDKFLRNKALNEYEISMRKEILESKPRAMIGMIMNKCNISCRICGIWARPNWQEPDRILKEIVDLLPYMEDICWQGGEVFYMKEFSSMLAEGVKCKNLNQVIFTNGLLLDEKNLDIIAKGRVELVLSIDGAKKETYEYIRRGANFETLCKKLELIKEVRKSTGAKINTYYNPVICKTNYKEIVDMVEFAHKYDFTAITLNPIRGVPEENIFEPINEEAFEYMRKIIPIAEAKAKEYGIRFNNWMPIDCGCKEISFKHSSLADNIENNKKEESLKVENNVKESIHVFNNKENKKNNRMICYAPWQRLLLDNDGQVRPYAICTKWIGHTKDYSLAQMWNNEAMQMYRRKIANNNFMDLCQPECISGQIRNKLCRPVEDK